MCNFIYIYIHIFVDTEKMQRYVNEEKQIREENLRLQRKLQLEVERREALCRHLSESESRYNIFALFCVSTYHD